MRNIALCLFFSLLLSSCQVSSKMAMQGEGGRTAYNVTLQKTTNEQMLLNLVRLRYIDFPFFLDVNNVTTQFTLGQKVSPLISIPGFNETNPGSIGGEVHWQNQPTISYTPLEGQSFARQLFRPLDLITIQQVIYSGWDIDRVLRLTMQSIDEVSNAPTAAGPAPELAPEYKEFKHMSELLRYFQLRGRLQVGVKIGKLDDHLHGKELQFSFPEKNEKAKELAKYFDNVNVQDNHYVVDVPLGFDKNIETGVMPRSIMGCLYFLSLGVETPGESYGYVSRTYQEDGESFDWNEVVGDLLQIKSSAHKPKDPFVMVFYKGFYYYIDDHDLSSKRTFILLLQLYNLQSSTPKAAAPLLSLPLG